MSIRLKPKKDNANQIVLVEDDELFAQKVRDDLKRASIDVIIHTDLNSALQFIESNHTHAVVTDIFLKDTKPNGLQVISKCMDKGIPVVLITSALDLHIAKEGLNRGAEFLLEKPFSSKELVGVLNDLWDNPRGLIGRRERFLDQSGLTLKEKEFARLMLKGLSNKEIAEILDTTVPTVKFYSNQIFEKCQVGSRGELFNTVFPT